MDKGDNKTWLRQNVGVPTQRTFERLGQVLEQSVPRPQRMEQQQVVSDQMVIPSHNEPIPVASDVPINIEQPTALDQSRLDAMGAVMDNMTRLEQKERELKKRLDAEDAIRAKEEAEFDPSSYRTWNPKTRTWFKRLPDKIK